LQGNGLRLVHQHANPANGAWTSYSALLTGSSWHVDSASGALATDGQLQSVLSDLTTLLIRAEYQTGADTDGLDNVALFQSPPGETPLPGALPLFASGLGMLGFIAHRRKRKAVAA
ncbi:MAG: laminin B domain-containing protein, partial [Xanthobacteraceae bacterium]